MEANKKRAIMHYVLHQNPPYIHCRVNDLDYMVMLNGRTFFDCGNGLTIPAPGCPCPEKLPIANMLYFLHINRKWMPFAVLLCLLAVVVNAGLMLTSGFEMAAAFGQQVSFWMNTALVSLFSLSLIALGIYNFKKGVVVQWGEKEEPKLLLAGEISIAPDVPLFSNSADETPEDYRIRVQAALSALVPGTWIVVMPFRQNFGVIQISNSIDEALEGHVFLRSNPIHDGGVEITQEQAIASANIYSRETWQDYAGYCREFADRFRLWAITEKMTSKNNPITTVLQQMAVVFALLLFAIPIFAQKSRQVSEYLGETRYKKEAPKNGEEVSFVFSKSVLTRIADGKKTYEKLLPSGPFFTDKADAGTLIGITVGPDDIAPVARITKETVVTKKEAAVSALPVSDEVGGSFLDNLPDSLALEGMKAQHLRDKALEWRKIHPVLDYYMWRFWGLMVILFGIGGAFWVIAKVSAKDSIKDLHSYAFLGNAITGMHIWSKTVLFCLMAVPTLVIIIDDAIRAYYTTVFGFWFVVKYAVAYYVWQFVFEKVLPDSPEVRTNRGIGNYPNRSQLGAGNG